MNRRIVLLVVLVSLLTACAQSNLHPTITIISNPNSLNISGQGFDPTANPCAHLSVIGLPSPSNAISIGDVACSNGAFTNFNWQYAYVGTSCTLNQSASATVFAIDTQGTNAGASQTTAFQWGQNCAIAGSCGMIGKPACPGGTCQMSGVNVGGSCVVCGGEGQPVCSGNTCQGDLHPNFQNGQIACTANCGHTQSNSNPFPQAPCVVPLVPPNLIQGGIYTCYDHSMIDQFGNCNCVPNTINTCPVSTSIPKPPQPNTGLCIQGQFKDLNGNGC